MQPTETYNRNGRGLSEGSRRCWFQPGNPGRKKGSRNHARPASRLLADMRWVYSHPEEEDKTPGHRHSRAWLKSDVKGFMKALVQLEKLVAGAASKPEVETKDEPQAEFDEGSARVMELIRQHLEPS